MPGGTPAADNLTAHDVRPADSPAHGSVSLQRDPNLENIFLQYVDPVYRFLYSRVGNREDAEDITSDVFLKAVRQVDSSRTDASVGKWLFTVARTALADHWRRHYHAVKFSPWDENAPFQTESEPYQPDTSSPKADVLSRVLSNLPERQRRVLELRFLHGYSIRETAEALGVTTENAKVIQHRALAQAVRIADGGK